jgi:AmmeMemoRadiSam system protein A
MNIRYGLLMPHPPIIIPDIGRGEEKKIRRTRDSMKLMSEEINRINPETIVLITPHGNLFRDAISVSYDDVLEGDFGAFGYSGLNMSFGNDIAFVDRILKMALENNIPAVKVDDSLKRDYLLDSRLDHGALVPLHFISKNYPFFKLVHITYGLLSSETLYEFGMIIKKAAKNLNRETIVIASGDLSHRLTKDAPAGYKEEGKVFDESMMRYLEKDDRVSILTFDEKLAEKAAECGLRSVQMMLGSLDGLETENRVLSYEGPFGVGYGCVELKVKGMQLGGDVLEEIKNAKKMKQEKRRQSEHQMVKLARKALETYVLEGRKLSLIEAPLEEGVMNEIQAGTFVSIKKNGELRGCIGTIFPTKEIVNEEIIENAINAGCYDPRFQPVEKSELDQLTYSVDILGKPEKINTKEMLDPQEYGVIVTYKEKKALLLPNLEGIDTVEEQLRIVLKKAGISKDDEFEMERFRVVRYQ